MIIRNNTVRMDDHDLIMAHTYHKSNQDKSSNRAMADCQVFTLQVQKTCSWNPGISPWWHIDLLKKAPTGWHVQTAPVLNQ